MSEINQGEFLKKRQSSFLDSLSFSPFPILTSFYQEQASPWQLVLKMFVHMDPFGQLMNGRMLALENVITCSY